MLRLSGDAIYLRALEPDDLDFLYKIENDTNIWEVSETQTPYSKFVLKQYLENAQLDIYEAKQLRLVICDKNKLVIGFVDLYEFDPKNKKAGIGVVILNTQRRKGFAEEALEILTSYCFEILHLHQVYAGVIAGNEASLALFKKLNFIQTGVRKDWIFTSEGYKDEVIFQKLNSKNVL